MHKTRVEILFSCVLAAVAGAALLGCDQEVDEGDDKLTEGNQFVEFVYGGVTQTVHFDNLATQYLFNDQPVVALTDVVVGSGLLVSTDGLWFDFVGTDGYTPAANLGCDADFAPTPADLLSKGYIERGTRRLLWEEDAEVPECVSVKDVAAVHVADSADELPLEPGADGDTDADTNAGSRSVAVDHAGDRVDVSFDGLETATIGDAEVVLLSTVLDASGLHLDLTSASLSLEGADGYNPADKGTCEEALPAAASLAGQAGIDLATNDVHWDPALELPGCAFVKDVAVIYVLDNE